MNSKQRAYLMSLAQTLDPVVQIGKATLTDEVLESIKEALEKRELIKISVLKNCADDPKALGYEIADETKSELVQVIGKKIVIYKMARDPKNRNIKL